MFRFSILAGGAALFLLTTVGVPQSPDAAPNSYVRLQNSTPGTQQTGHANISGTLIAGQFQGGGAGLTGVNADLLDGLNSTAFLQSVPVPLTLSGTSNTHIIRGENTSTGAGASGVYGLASAGAGATFGGLFQSDSTDGRGVVGLATATTGGTATAGVWGEINSTNGSGVFGFANAATGITYGGLFQSDSTDGRGVVGLATAATGITYGGRFESASNSGIGVFGSASAASGQTFGVYGQSASPGGSGLLGRNVATSGFANGVTGITDGTAGRGVAGRAFNISGANVGVDGISDGNSGRGVQGYARSTTGETFGGHFISDSTNGTGVLGEAHATSGVTWGAEFSSDSTSGIGVKGNANAMSGSTYGVFGRTNSPTNGYGVYSQGRFGASGTKSFRVDHPLDPENKYLSHYCTEGPEPINSYSGNVLTDARGEAWVELPPYFAEINTDFRYVLTVVDDSDSNVFVQAKVARKIKDNRFKIRTNAPNVEVSWEVKGVRNDPWVRKYGAPVEVGKQAHERGKYQHPELYGMPKEMGINYRPDSLPPRDSKRK